MLLATLIPEASYEQVLVVLFRDLALLPSQRLFGVPVDIVLPTGRDAADLKPVPRPQDMVRRCRLPRIRTRDYGRSRPTTRRQTWSIAR